MIQKTTPETAPRVQANLDGRIMYSGKKAESILLTLKPGETIPSHTNPFDVLFIGIEGKADIISQEKQISLNPCETLFISSEEPREMQNLSDLTLKVMVVKLF